MKAAILAAAPLPEAEPAALAGEDALDGLRAELAAGLERIRSVADADLAELRGRLEFTTTAVDEAMAGLQGITDRLGRLELAAGADAYPTKKAHLLALYRAHGDYGRREAAGRVAGELAGPAGLQAGTARAYIYEELSRLAAQGKEDQ